MSNTAGQRLLQQDLQTQLNTCLIRFEYDMGQRLGQYTLQKLQNNGLELLRSGREALLKLIDQVHQAFGLGQGLHHFEFQRHMGSYCNADRPAHVEDGYIYLHLAEHSILRYFLQQKPYYKVMLELLTEHVIRYTEKSYYQIEQHWQEFQSHFMILDSRSEGPSHNISLDGKHEIENSAIKDHEITAVQIAQRHRRIQQLQAIARSFWQDNFAAALGQLRLDLPNWQETSNMLHNAEPTENAQEQRVAFAPYYIALLKELESRCNLAQQHQNLQHHLRKILEQSFDGFPLQAVATTSSEIRYTEYSEEESILPDELARLNLRYATNTWLQHWETQSEEQFIALSRKIHYFFAQVEKATHFQWLHAWLRSLFRLLPRRNTIPENVIKTVHTPPSAERAERNIALEELLQKSAKDLSPFGHNLGYEIHLLLELLQRADWALQYQPTFRSKHYKLLQQLQQLRYDLLSLCHQPFYGNDVGIQITAFYRTVRKRRETFSRLEKILQDFCTNCQLREL